MTKLNTPHALLVTEDGPKLVVREPHTKNCRRAERRPKWDGCPACLYEFHVQELLKLSRYEVTGVLTNGEGDHDDPA